MRTISNSRYRTLARTSISLTTPNTQASRATAACGLQLLWISTVYVEHFQPFLQMSLIHSLEASDLASVLIHQIYLKWNSFQAPDFMCKQCAIKHFFVHNWKVKYWKLHNHTLYFGRTLGKLVKSQDVRNKALDKQGQIFFWWNLRNFSCNWPRNPPTFTWQLGPVSSLKRTTHTFLADAHSQ